METNEIYVTNEKYQTQIDECSMWYDVSNKRLINGYLSSHKEIKQYSVREGTKIICEDVFRNSEIEFIQLPKSLEVIGKSVFMDCESLKKISFPNGLQKIESKAFMGCTSLKSIYIPASVINFGNYVFDGCFEIESFEIDSNNKNYLFENGIIYSKDKTSIICAINSLIENEISLPDGLIEIKDGAFANCRNLKSIKLPNSIKTLGKKAFYNCINLHSTNFPNSLKSIGYKCFSHSTIKKVTIPESIEFIGSMAFSACYALSEINVKSNLHYKSIDGVLFSKENNSLLSYPSASNRTYYIIPKHVKRIESGAFLSCMYLKKVELTKGITELKDETFANCKELFEIKIHEGVIKIGRHVFGCCVSLEKIKLPSTLKSAGNEAFAYCSSLNKINIPKELTDIRTDTFFQSFNLKFNVHPLNPRYKSFKGVLYEKSIGVYGYLDDWNEIEVPF